MFQSLINLFKKKEVEVQPEFPVQESPKKEVVVQSKSNPVNSDVVVKKPKKPAVKAKSVSRKSGPSKKKK